MALLNYILKYQILTYGITITPQNQYVDFYKGMGLTAILNTGYYTLNGLAREVARAMHQTDPLNIYTVTINRNGTTQFLTIQCSGGVFSLLFASGPNTANNAAALMGYTVTDKTGAARYTASLSIGINVFPDLPMYNYFPPQFISKFNGTVNVAADGTKEAIIFAQWQFSQFEFQYIKLADGLAEWVPFLNWASKQRPWELTPWDDDPNRVYEGTFETTVGDGKGMGYQLSEMLPNFPGLFKTGTIKMRIDPATVPV